MKKSQIKKIILNISRIMLILNTIIIYTVSFLSYINKNKINSYTSFPWYTNIIVILTILSLSTFIFVIIHYIYYKKVYFKLPLKTYMIAICIFVIAIALGVIDYFIGKIPFYIILSLLLVAFILFIILLSNMVITYIENKN